MTKKQRLADEYVAIRTIDCEKISELPLIMTIMANSYIHGYDAASKNLAELKSKIQEWLYNYKPFNADKLNTSFMFAVNKILILIEKIERGEE